jgi:hypothetical protein
MTIDLDKLEALARVATEGPWHNAPEDKPCDTVLSNTPTKRGNAFIPDETERAYYGGFLVCESAAGSDREFIAALNPAVVLQWIAETRDKDAKLWVAVEALKYYAENGWDWDKARASLATLADAGEMEKGERTIEQLLDSMSFAEIELLKIHWRR